MSKQSELDRWCVAFLDGDMSAGQFKRAITDWHQQEIAKARIDELRHVISKTKGVGIWSWYNKDFVSRENRIAQLKEELEK